LGDRGEVRPPHCLRVVLHPAGVGHRYLVRAARGGDNGTDVADQHALGAGGADVDTEQQRAHRAVSAASGETASIRLVPIPAHSMSSMRHTARSSATWSPGIAWMWLAP